MLLRKIRTELPEQVDSLLKDIARQSVLTSKIETKVQSKSSKDANIETERKHKLKRLQRKQPKSEVRKLSALNREFIARGIGKQILRSSGHRSRRENEAQENEADSSVWSTCQVKPEPENGEVSLEILYESIANSEPRNDPSALPASSASSLVIEAPPTSSFQAPGV